MDAADVSVDGIAAVVVVTDDWREENLNNFKIQKDFHKLKWRNEHDEWMNCVGSGVEAWGHAERVEMSPKMLLNSIRN